MDTWLRAKLKAKTSVSLRHRCHENECSNQCFATRVYAICWQLKYHNTIYYEVHEPLTLYVPESKMAEFANSVDLDQVAHNEQPHQDLHCLSSFFNYFNSD